MGKIIKTKAHRGTHRSAGAFHSSEVLAASSMAMELEDMATSKNEPAKQPRREEASVAATASAEEEVGGGSVHAMPIGHMSRGQRRRFARKASVKNKMLLAGKLRGKEIKLKEGALGEMGALELSLPSPPATKVAITPPMTTGSRVATIQCRPLPMWPRYSPSTACLR